MYLCSGLNDKLHSPDTRVIPKSEIKLKQQTIHNASNNINYQVKGKQC